MLTLPSEAPPHRRLCSGPMLFWHVVDRHRLPHDMFCGPCMTPDADTGDFYNVLVSTVIYTRLVRHDERAFVHGHGSI